MLYTWHRSIFKCIDISGSDTNELQVNSGQILPPNEFRSRFVTKLGGKGEMGLCFQSSLQFVIPNLGSQYLQDNLLSGSILLPHLSP